MEQALSKKNCQNTVHFYSSISGQRQKEIIYNDHKIDAHNIK